MNLRRIYKALLRLYPSDYWRLFSAEMMATFEESVAEHRERGWGVFLHFAILELVDLLTAVGSESLGFMCA